MYALWYLFDKDDTEYLFKIIKDLAKKYDAPIFIPHITAYGLLDIELNTLDEKILGIIQDLSPFFIEKNKLDFSDNLWKTLFVDILPNTHLEKINKHLTLQFSDLFQYEFLPHISLIYKNMGSTVKHLLAENLEIKKNFRIIGLGIQQFSENIEEWEVVREYKFNEII